MSTIDLIDKEIKNASENKNKRSEYIKKLKQSPEFQEYIIGPIQEGLEEIKSVQSIDMTQDSEKIISQIEAQKISYQYLTLLLSFFLKNDID